MCMCLPYTQSGSALHFMIISRICMHRFNDNPNSPIAIGHAMWTNFTCRTISCQEAVQGMSHCCASCKNGYRWLMAARFAIFAIKPSDPSPNMAPTGRRKDTDSSSSSSSPSDSSPSSDSDRSHKKHKPKKDKKQKKKDKRKIKDQGTQVYHPSNTSSSSAHTYTHSSTTGAQPNLVTKHLAAMSFPEPTPQFPTPKGEDYTPPQYQEAPPSGFRVPLTTQAAFPDNAQAGPAPFHDLDGSPVFIGSALMERSVHPCKIGPHLQPSCVAVPYGGTEFTHHGRYDLLPYRAQDMEWVPTSQGHIPQGRRAVEGGYEESGSKLYHAAASINGLKVPGKAGEHLGGARISFGGQEYEISDNYDLLCWRY
ncbi:hypothetical protein D9619_004254 [Psilocybe cf. subviscida]|uniref:Uncharacterized protein n=1 Tax=Psilocybe cf. subviscida TaxID=2480587 RepID=A0A8H5BQD9_9AGAR|nr:hypothetical protein D9619_004254 [Psilocybe cf. subviscida]